MAEPAFVQDWSSPNTSGGGGSETVANVSPSGGDDSCLVAVVAVRDAGADATVASVVFNGTEAFSEAHAVGYNNDSRVAIWVLTGPTAATGNVVVTFNNTANDICAWVGEYTGVDQTTPVGAVGSGTATSGSIDWTITTQHADSRIVSGCSYGNGVGAPLSFTSADTERHVAASGTSGTDVQILVGDREAATATGYTISAQSVVQGHEWACGTIELRAASGGTNATATPDGVSGTGSIGSVQVNLDATVTLTGVEGTGSVGTASVSTGANDNAAPDGVAGTGAVGTVTVTTSATATVTGVSGTGAVGSLTVTTTGDATVEVTGVSASGEVGTVTIAGIAEVAAVSGVEAQGSVGTVTILGWLTPPPASNDWSGEGSADDIWTPVAAASGDWS